jgi:hypothetical protein
MLVFRRVVRRAVGRLSRFEVVIPAKAGIQALLQIQTLHGSPPSRG